MEDVVFEINVPIRNKVVIGWYREPGMDSGNSDIVEESIGFLQLKYLLFA